jgi:nitrogen fixation protein NifZ
MIDLREPKFEWGQPVVAAIDLYNDGGVPGAEEDTLLVAAGGPGEIVRVGHHDEAKVPVYMVDFGVAVLGCLEEEIALATRASAQQPEPGSPL